MHYNSWGAWGMHFFWWLFWMLLIVVVFLSIQSSLRGRRHENPLEVLQRRYAAGEIDTAEYEERKAKLECDAKSDGS